MRWLVTGSTGFIGRAVAEALLAVASPQDIVGLCRHASSPTSGGMLAIDLASVEPRHLAERLADQVPDVVIHCAGRTPPASTSLYFNANTRATAALLEACRLLKRPMRFVHVGSAAELGPVPAYRLPVDETCPACPRDAYALSKWAATRLALDAHMQGNLEVVVGRVFNPTGPGLPHGQAFGRFAHSLAHARGDPVLLSAGDLQARRDFIDVRDVAAALVILALQGRAGEIYQVATGASRSIGAGLGTLIRLSGRSVRIAPSSHLASGAFESRGSIEKIRRDTRWSPAIGFEQSLQDLWTSALQQAQTASSTRHVA